MHAVSLLLDLVVIAALAFGSTKGSHDTAKAAATTVTTRGLKPRMALALASAMNLLGAFLSLKLADSMASGMVDQEVGAQLGSCRLHRSDYLECRHVLSWDAVEFQPGLDWCVIGVRIVSLAEGAVLRQGIVSKLLFPRTRPPQCQWSPS